MRPSSAPINTFTFGGQTITTRVYVMVPRALAGREAYVDVVAAMDEQPRSRSVPLRMLGDRPAGGSRLESDPFAEVQV